jgi:hypothetical protein
MSVAVVLWHKSFSGSGTQTPPSQPDHLLYLELSILSRSWRLRYPNGHDTTRSFADSILWGYEPQLAKRISCLRVEFPWLPGQNQGFATFAILWAKDEQLRIPSRFFAAVCALLFAFTTFNLIAQEPLPTGRMPSDASERMPFGVAVKASSLGAGVEVAAGIAKHWNVRVGGNFFNYNVSENNASDAIHLHTVDGHLDWFPWGGKFHIGPGLLYSLTDPVTAKIAVPGGNTFTLGSTDFVSSSVTPVTGNTSVRVHHLDPTFTAGLGNLLSRAAGKHWSIPFEFGVAYQGDPRIPLALQGTACTSGGACYDAATAPAVLGPLQQEIHKRENDARWFKFYPLVSIGLGYRF